MKESYPIPSYYGFPYIPWFFQMYQVVKTFTEQGVERNIDVQGPLFSGNSTSGTLLEMFFIKSHVNGT